MPLGVEGAKAGRLPDPRRREDHQLLLGISTVTFECAARAVVMSASSSSEPPIIIENEILQGRKGPRHDAIAFPGRRQPFSFGARRPRRARQHWRQRISSYFTVSRTALRRERGPVPGRGRTGPCVRAIRDGGARTRTSSCPSRGRSCRPRHGWSRRAELEVEYDRDSVPHRDRINRGIPGTPGLSHRPGVCEE